MLLFNPSAYDAAQYDEPTRRALLAVRRFFEAKGHAALKAESHDAAWYEDFLAMLAREGIFARFGTPAAVGTLSGGSEATTARWDTARNNDLSQLLAWYSLEHWYAWQVTVLGLGPVWTSGNAEAKRLVGQLLAQGGLFAFGLSEREHGADIYSTDMVLSPDGAGWRASGEKYYIGNGNCAARVSVFGRVQRPEGPSANPADDYLFFLADPKHPTYTLVQNVVHGQMYVSEFRLTDYPVTPADVLHTGKAAWDAALATVNVGKVQLAWASIGIAEHAFVEAIGHAHRRVLYGTRVTDFPHVRRLLADAYVRLVAMKLYSARCSDYERSASAEDRRFLLYNPIAKMKVTSEGERVVDLLWEVIAAKGFEKDTYFEQATRHIRTLPKLEGTVHVNLALVLKFLPAFAAAGAGQGVKYAAVPVRLDPADDSLPVRTGAGERPVAHRLPGLARCLCAVRAAAERRDLHRPGAGVRTVDGHGGAARGAGQGPGFPAQRRADLHPDRLRATGCRSRRPRHRRRPGRDTHRNHGRLRRSRREPRRPDVRRVRAGPERVRGRRARAGIRHPGATGRRPGAHPSCSDRSGGGEPLARRGCLVRRLSGR